jgi:phenylpropionate dioxygenase-like ring-hydroxylating dioxygenase large terminal subunit
MRRISEPRLVPHRADWTVLCEHQLELQRRGFVPAGSGANGDLQRFTAAIVASDTSSWPARAYASWLPDVSALPADRRRAWSRYFLWPNVALDVYPDQMGFSQVLPLGPGESLVRELAYALPDNSREMRLARYLNARIRRRLATEDRRHVERRQQGLDACGDIAGPLANDEPGQRWFTARVAAALRASGHRGRRAPRAR